MNVLRELVSNLSSEYGEYFDKQEILSILDEGDELDKDITISSGAHLELCCLKLIGRKSDDLDADFVYERKFYPGINTLISDNLKGKSTIFKSIKLALTGRDSLKKDVSGWIQLIFLEFKIGKITYTSYIDKSEKRMKSTLYRASIDEYNAGDIDDIDLVFSASGKEEYEQYCERFFYGQLGVNSLKWTQKDSRKTVNKLHEAGTSWSTFFKTIYLESKDSGTLFYGNQGGLLVQILLGLGLTSSMNRLKIKKEMLQFDSSTNVKSNKHHEIDSEELIFDLREFLKSSKAELKSLQKVEGVVDISSMVDKKSSLIIKLRDIEEKRVSNIRNKSKAERLIAGLISDKRRLDSEWIKLDEQKKKNQKSYLRIEEHIEIGSFFSNLEIKSCPSCNNNIDNSKHDFIESHSCNLCHHEVKDFDRKEDVSHLKMKKQGLESEVDKIEEQLRNL